MPLRIEKIEALAPDQASLDAARKLLKPSSWPTLAYDGKDMVWGECQGSGSTPYRTVIDEQDAWYKCSCPSRKFPCKHSLALMWFRAEGKQTFTQASLPDWAQEWLNRRRSPSAAKPEAELGKAKASISSTVVEEQVDPKAEARAAQARERNQKEREIAMLAGLDDLDTWISDQLERGLVNFPAHAADDCRLLAQRMVDAKLSALSVRIDTFPARLFAVPEADRPLMALRELGLLHLLAQAYRNQDELNTSQRLDVRQICGWTLTREQVLADTETVRVQANWRVLGSFRTTQVDRLIRQETWLIRQSDIGNLTLPRYALFLDYVPVSAAGSRSPYLCGEVLQAELCFFPGIQPLRALIARQDGPSSFSEDPLLIPAQSLNQSYEEFLATMVRRPWNDLWPLSFATAHVERTGKNFVLVDPESKICLPLDQEQAGLWQLSRLGTIAGLGLWDGTVLRLWWAETPIGPWKAS